MEYKEVSKKQKQRQRLGRLIKKGREKKGWTQDDLAKITGYDVSLISHWEVGKRTPTALTLIELIKKLELKV